MKRGVVLLLAFIVQPAWAINKCRSPHGEIVYTDKACSKGAHVGEIELMPPVSNEDKADAQRRAQQMREEVTALRTKEAEEQKQREQEATIAWQKQLLEAQRAQEQRRSLEKQDPLFITNDSVWVRSREAYKHHPVVDNRVKHPPRNKEHPKRKRQENAQGKVR